ncbi:Pyridoxamine 5'-phosphate oxidase [Vulgatibacter incomptus]|uniref:Pyridoxamine 5'-phosphate oxidase n=2 Tax=Vulgatibacter incomptus TaxID=1391653 RepID=A0A0K1P9W3_9BACT|nr:Pyridoxamine 5'-phosphate oxidase [Vulgatibacter incomptus]
MEDLHPIAHFERLLAGAIDAGLPLPNAVALATADQDGRPSVRMVLLKGVDDRGFVFYTNLESRKAHELQANPFAALCFHWATLEEQVRVEGRIEQVDDEEADAYFRSRPRGSQIGAWASKQSSKLDSREELVGAVAEVEHRFEGKEVTRPPFWSGFRIVPDRIEFWSGKADRLHDRLIFLREGEGWRTEWLYP